MSTIENLLDIMRQLRQECSWDREQTFASIAPYTVEEACEVADAIARQVWDELRGELGDVLFAVVNLSRHPDIDPEHALSDANRRFEQRFRLLEQTLTADGRSLADLDLEQLEQGWQAGSLRGRGYFRRAARQVPCRGAVALFSNGSLQGSYDSFQARSMREPVIDRETHR